MRKLKSREGIQSDILLLFFTSSKIIKYARIVYNQKTKNTDIGYTKNTVDFKLLEEKLKEWNNEDN